MISWFPVLVTDKDALLVTGGNAVIVTVRNAALMIARDFLVTFRSGVQFSKLLDLWSRGQSTHVPLADVNQFWNYFIYSCCQYSNVFEYFSTFTNKQFCYLLFLFVLLCIALSSIIGVNKRPLT